MTHHSRIRRIGWLAALAICTALYLLLHLKVNAVHSEVVRAERAIVQLERHKLFLETEFATRSSQLQLESWNRVEFGYTAPTAQQFINGERQLAAAFGMPRAPGAPEPIMVASRTGETDAVPFPQMVSPLTGKPLPAGLIEDEEAPELAMAALGGEGRLRIPLAASLTEGTQ